MFQNSNTVPKNCSTGTNDNFAQTIRESKESNFDRILKEKWEEAQNKGVFRYTLNIQDTKVLDGKFQFIAQLNTDRGYNRRSPEDITSMTQFFNEKRFNFTQLTPEEKIMDLSNGDEEDIIAVNISPLEYCHSLLLPQRYKRLPQVVTKHSLYKAIEMFSLSSSSLEEYIGPVQNLRNYPAKGFCIKRSNVQNIDDLVAWAFLIINYLQQTQIAHNVYITRAKADSGEEYEDLRIYIWARKSSKGIKDTNIFVPAACELFGHIVIKAEEAYQNLSEEYVAHILTDITEEPFLLVLDEVRNLIQEQLMLPGL